MYGGSQSSWEIGRIYRAPTESIEELINLCNQYLVRRQTNGTDEHLI
jgi:hypothetical protein